MIVGVPDYTFHTCEQLLLKNDANNKHVWNYIVILRYLADLSFLGWLSEFPYFFIFNPLTTNVPHHIEASQLICNANQLNGFYMIGNIGR